MLAMLGHALAAHIRNNTRPLVTASWTACVSCCVMAPACCKTTCKHRSIWRVQSRSITSKTWTYLQRSAADLIAIRCSIRMRWFSRSPCASEMVATLTGKAGTRSHMPWRQMSAFGKRFAPRTKFLADQRSTIRTSPRFVSFPLPSPHSSPSHPQPLSIPKVKPKKN